MAAPSRTVIWVANDRTTKGCWAASGTTCDEGGRVGARGCASRVVTASLSLLIARHEGGPRPRDVPEPDARATASDATHSRVQVAAHSEPGRIAWAAVQQASERHGQLPRRCGHPQLQPTGARHTAERVDGVDDR